VTKKRLDRMMRMEARGVPHVQVRRKKGGNSSGGKRNYSPQLLTPAQAGVAFENSAMVRAQLNALFPKKDSKS
jgi:hypothetical protein